MLRGSIDQVLESLCVASKRHLADCGHGQQSPKGIESLLLENAVLLTEVRLQPGLQGAQKRHIGIEQMIHRPDVLGEQPAAFQIRTWNVVEITPTDLRPEVDVTRGLFDGLESDAL